MLEKVENSASDRTFLLVTGENVTYNLLSLVLRLGITFFQIVLINQDAPLGASARLFLLANSERNYVDTVPVRTVSKYEYISLTLFLKALQSQSHDIAALNYMLCRNICD